MLLVAPIVAVSVAGTIGNALTPTLLAKHPLLLIALEARNRNLILASTRVDPVPFVLVALVRRIVSDPLFYALGYLYGDAAVRWIERKMGDAGAVVRGIERAFSKAAPLMVFLVPGALVCVLAGATRMSPPLFLAMNVAGTLTVLVALYAAGDALERPVGSVNDFVSDNFKWLTVVSVLLTLWWLYDQRRRGRSEIESITTIERELEEEAREAEEAGAPEWAVEHEREQRREAEGR